MSKKWIDALRAACARVGSQARVAAQIGYSPAVVNQVLKGVYKGDIARVQQAVEGALMGATVDCPVLGELPRNRCLENQDRPFAATNPIRVQLYRTCRESCPHSDIRRD